MDLRGAIVSNWGYKLAAFVIVSLLWLSLSADERQSQPVRTIVSVEVLDSAWVLVNAPTEVSATFQGRNRDLAALLVNEPEIRIVIDSVLGPGMQVEIDLSRVTYDRELDVRPTSVVPRSLELQFERKAERRVPVVAEIDAIPATGFTVLRPILVSPDTVTVRGPASEVESITRVATRRIRLEDVANTVMRDLPIELPTGVRSVSVDPASALVTVEVDSLLILTRRVPVRLVGAGTEGLQITPDSVDAVIRGAATAVRRRLEALGSVDAPLDDAADLPTRIFLGTAIADSGFVSVRFVPPEVFVQQGPTR
ncbi:MAG: CdaR family protein [Gemmatimonadota bacterium]